MSPAASASCPRLRKRLRMSLKSTASPSAPSIAVLQRAWGAVGHSSKRVEEATISEVYWSACTEARQGSRCEGHGMRRIEHAEGCAASVLLQDGWSACAHQSNPFSTLIQDWCTP